MANIKNTSEILVGDTLTSAKKPTAHPLPGFKAMHPMVFTGLYPIDGDDYEKLKYSMEKLALNDSSFQYQTESSVALGFGFRCGFLGLLHMEIVQERLRREYDCDIIATYPGVVYRVRMNDGEVKEIDNPVFLPDPTEIDGIEEPIVKMFLICLGEQIGDMMKLIMEKRGTIERTESLDTKRVMLTCTMPLNEILIDFHDKLKSLSRGYASMDYEEAGYREDDLVKLDILVHGDPVEAFSCIVHRDKAEARGRQICEVLVDLIPPQQFSIAIQAAIGAKIIARTTVRAYRKDVTAKCYGGDITRKRKLLEKQKEGKKRMKQFGKVGIPQEAFIAVLKTKN
jgi:GTP-binding protein LepA